LITTNYFQFINGRPLSSAGMGIFSIEEQERQLTVMAKTVNGFKTKLKRELAKKMGLFLD